jgi:hypothetical protein
MFAGPIGLIMLLGEWLLLYLAWVHPWAWRQQQQQQQQIGSRRLSDGLDDSASEGDAARIELELLSQTKARAADADADADADDDDDADDGDGDGDGDGDAGRRRRASGAPTDERAARAAQAEAIRALYGEMGPITRTQKVQRPADTRPPSATLRALRARDVTREKQTRPPPAGYDRVARHDAAHVCTAAPCIHSPRRVLTPLHVAHARFQRETRLVCAASQPQLRQRRHRGHYVRHPAVHLAPRGPPHHGLGQHCKVRPFTPLSK